MTSVIFDILHCCSQTHIGVTFGGEKYLQWWYYIPNFSVVRQEKNCSDFSRTCAVTLDSVRNLDF